MKKIIIIGSPGAGKSTFAKKLSKETGIPLYHLDMYWHRPDKTTVTRDDFDKKLLEIMSKDEWIIDGNYQRTMRQRLEHADTVFLLDFSLDVCLSGAAARIGIARDDMPWVEEKLDDEFKAWIEAFPEKTLPKIYELLREFADKEIHIFKSRKEADDFFRSSL